MKKYTKQILALLLVICTLVSLTMPTVFATGTGIEGATGEDISGEGTPGADTSEPVSVLYEFYTPELGNAYAKLLDQAPAIKAAYDEGTGNWRFEAANDSYQFRPNGGGNKFRADYASLMYTTGASNATNTRFFALRIKSPGEGKFDLTFNHGATTTGAKKGSVYFVDAAVIDEALGENATAYADAMAANIYQPGTGIYTAYTAAITEAIKGQTAAIIADYTEAEPAVGTYTFEADKEYVAVFTSDVASSGGNLFLVSLEATQVIEEIPDPVDYIIYTDELGNAYTKLSVQAAVIKEAYDAGESNWRFEAASSSWQFRPAGSNKFNKEVSSLVYTTGASNATTTHFFAIRIKSPGEGKFDLTFNHGVSTSGAKKGSVYFVDAAVIDEALGENAAAYAEAMSANPYEPGEGVYAAYTAAITEAIKGQTAAMVVDYTVEEPAVGSFTFEADKEYVAVFTSDVASNGGNLYFVSLSAVLTTGDDSDEPEKPAYTDGLYDFNDILLAGSNMANSKDILVQMYDENKINWRYEAHGGGLDLNKVAYHSATDSVRAISAKNWWLAVRIKAPAEDGTYDIKMTHGAAGEGAAVGSIFVIPGDTPTNQIFKIASKKGATITADWYYGEATSDTMKGRETATGSVAMKADQEYIVVFLPTETSPISANACFYMGQLEVTRTGDYVEEENGGDEIDGVEYEFYDWDNPGHFVNHYKTEEQLGKKILTKQIAEKYAAGEMNWCYQSANGFANFSTGTPYMNINVGETHYYVVKIKAPGTGTYEITYNHLAMNDTSSGLRGGVFIMPYEEGITYQTIRDEANFKDPIINTVYYAEKTTEVQKTGTYTAFQEGKEYLICFSVEDNNPTEVRTLKAYPVSMIMKRTGEYAPEPGAGAEDGVVYNFAQKQYANKKLEGDVYYDLDDRYKSGALNWNYETVRGSAKFTTKYIQFGTGYNGGPMVIRFKSPGEGKYKVTLRLLQFPNADAANYSQIYIVDAPEARKDSSYYTDRMARLPMAETTFNTYSTRMQKVTVNGEYNFQADKEYALIIYMNDEEDNRRTTDSCWGYAERMVLKRIGEYEGEEEHITRGGLVLQSPVASFNIAESYFVTWVMNDHDYIAIPIVGNTMLIYDLDEWRLVDEVRTNVYTPRGTVIDKNGNIWVCGDRQYMYCYNPFTGEGFSTGKISNGSSLMAMCAGDDGYLYFSSSHPDGASIYRYNPETLEYVTYPTYSWCTTAGETMQKGDYIYFTANSTNRHWLVKMDKLTGKIVSTGDFTENVQNKQRYTIGMEFLDDHLMRLTTPLGVTIFNLDTMTMLTQEEHGLKGPLKGHTSDVLDGRVYFTCSIDGLCYYDQETQTFGVVGGEIAKNKTKLVGKGRNTVTIDDPLLPGTSIITYGGMKASGLSLYAYNLQSMKVVELMGLVSPDFGSPQEMRELIAGPAGSNELYFSSIYFAPVQVYNTETRELGREITTGGQNDTFHWYKDTLYIGNYTECELTQVVGGTANKLFTLKRHFKQSRIHTISGGDDKLFVGTVPDAYNHGGLIAWYDQNTGLTYVVTGPDPEDVYYARFKGTLPTNDWYRATTDEPVDIESLWDKDEDGDGVYQYFKGPIPMQTITKVDYRDGYLYGLSSTGGGSNSTILTNESAKVFIYDVENMKMVKVIDLRDYISGLPTRIGQIESLAVDPEIDNKVWGVMSETLFSVTFDKDTGKVDVKVELSFRKGASIDASGWATKNIIFDGDYLYCLMGTVGGLVKVNRKDTSDYEQILYNFKSRSEIPKQIVIGNDGDLYYTTGGTKVYVFNLDVTEEELAAAKVVQDAIDLIPDAFTLEDRGIIEEARRLFDELAPANQPYVNNADKLTDAEIEMFRLRVEGLGEITIEDEMEVRALIEEYRQLELDVRMTIDYQKIAEAHGKMSILVAERMVNNINSIGTVTLDKQEFIRACRAEYLALSLYERRLVTNEETLNAAEAALTGLLLAKNEAAAVDKLISEIGSVFFSNTKIKAAREAYDKLSDAGKDFVENYDILKKAETTLIVEYVIAAILVVGAAAVVIVVLRKKSSTKAKAE